MTNILLKHFNSYLKSIIEVFLVEQKNNEIWQIMCFTTSFILTQWKMHFIKAL